MVEILRSMKKEEEDERKPENFAFINPFLRNHFPLRSVAYFQAAS